MSDTLQVSYTGRVVRLCLNRPEKRNALTTELCRDLVRAVDQAVSDPRCGAILLTANGKSFCAGMDVAELGQVSSDEINSAQEQLFTLGSRVTTPIVAGVRGAAFGGGTGLVANCHIVVASEDATFGLTEIRLGLWPFLIHRTMVAAIGERRTVELALTGRVFGSREARELGLIHEISPDPEARALEIAENLAAACPTAIRWGMGFVQEVRGHDWEKAGRTARRIRDELFKCNDLKEGIRAFQEKRAPRWPSLPGPGPEGNS